VKSCLILVTATGAIFAAYLASHSPPDEAYSYDTAPKHDGSYDTGYDYSSDH
jgi:hypothetical protein